ncbi:MAG TPA: DUF6544 family protein [Chitinophagaceae bacterium]|nr:DUF6544 family protein [Chitinophagaceae bacterium]
MLKYLFAFIILIHGLIHFMGFAKAFNYGELKQLTLPISKTQGTVWLITALLFIFMAAAFLIKKENWWVVAFPAVALSQLVIIQSWKDAKYGTIANIIILVVAVLALTLVLFENKFRRDVKESLQRTEALPAALLTEEDLQHLPEPVQRYLRYSGVIGKTKVKNVYIAFEGKMRDKKRDYFSFRSEQYNFFDEPTRLFFMKGKMKGITVPGYHHYKNGNAVMDIRLFGLIPVVHKSGQVMNKAETVTVFNDMCLFAPAALIDNRIRWQTIDSLSVKASFTNKNITISAELKFDKEGKLINFISGDRTELNSMEQIPWSTPIHQYKEVKGIKLMSEGDAVWHYPDSNFIYGQFTLKEIAYNLKY